MGGLPTLLHCDRRFPPTYAARWALAVGLLPLARSAWAVPEDFGLRNGGRPQVTERLLLLEGFGYQCLGNEILVNLYTCRKKDVKIVQKDEKTTWQKQENQFLPV